MTTSAPTKSCDDFERLSIYAPEGTKAMLEAYRRRKGFRSRNEVVMHFINSAIFSEAAI